MKFSAAHRQYLAAVAHAEAAFETPDRPAAWLVADAAEAQLNRLAVGHLIEYVELPGQFGVVMETYDRGDFRADMHGVSYWGDVRPAVLPSTFACRVWQRRARRLLRSQTRNGVSRWTLIRPWTNRMGVLMEKAVSA